MFGQIAHNIDVKKRTDDINISENVDFAAMLLSDPILQGLLQNGFKKPSPIQLKAIPMGRCGFDLIIKAKSGTGKTAVFGIIALEMINLTQNDLQVLILAPTREIAVQIQQVIVTIGINLKGLRVEYFIGGTSQDEDISKLKHCHIAVGSPGRVKDLIKKGAMKVDSVKLFVLDEADKLMQDSFQADINFIYNKLSARKQMIASSATYPDELDKFLINYMHSPMHISPNANVPVLLGIKQFVSVVESHLNVMQQMTIKINELNRILQSISFTQCIVFSNYQTRAESLSNNLTRLGWPSIYISAAQKQKARLEAVSSLKEFKCRILSTTDLTARGIDAANVDLVINYEVPHDAETYLHRMGRAGRYGSSGICITIAANGTDVDKLNKIIGDIGSNSFSIYMYPNNENMPKDIWNCDVNQFKNFVNTVGPSTSNDSEVICSSLKDLTVERESKDLDVSNVEMLLDNLNQEDASSVKMLKSKYNSLDPATVLDLLSNENCTDKTKSNCNSTETVTDVGMMLLNLQAEDETTKNDLKDKFNHLDVTSVFNTLSAGENIDKISKSKSKKVKTDGLKSKKQLNKNENVAFENEAKSFQENTTVNKNIALYNVTKFLVDEKEVVTEESVSNVEKLLNLITQEDVTEKSELDLNSLPLINEKEPDITTDEKSVTTLSCKCPENLFSKSFSYAISASDQNWQNDLCDQHSVIHDDNVVTATEYGAEMEEVYYEETEEYISETEPVYNDVENNEEELSENNTLDENLFVKAYDYALYSEESCDVKITNEEESNIAACGYAVDNSYNYLVANTKYGHSNKRKHTKYKNEVPTNIKKIETASKNDYESYFEYCDNVLTQNAPYFVDVDSFEKWFRQWQENVYAVRNYIQQDVFTKEMLSKNKTDV